MSGVLIFLMLQLLIKQVITIEDVRQPYPETRYITYALINDHLYVFAWCYRGKNLRVISLRKANTREERKYAGD